MAESNAEERSLADSLSALLESGDGADVTLVVDGSELLAHRSILAARSPVFATMLRHDMREVRSCRIEIADVREAVLRQLLKFIYTDTAPQLDNMAAELLPASDKYDLPVLKKRCEQTLLRDLTVDNAATTAVLADLHSCRLLKKAAVDFIVSHLQVMATDGWKNVLLPNVKVAAEICSLMAVAASSSTSSSAGVATAAAATAVAEEEEEEEQEQESSSSKMRVLSEDDKETLVERLLRAAEDGDLQAVRKLLAAGAPVDGRNSSGDTALHRAVMHERDSVVRCLVYAGAEVNIGNAIRQTPLHCAVELSYQAGVKMLLVAGANKHQYDDDGYTPEMLADSSIMEIFHIL